MSPTRRTLLLGSAVTASSLWATSTRVSARLTDKSGADQPLPIPPLLDARGHGQALALTAQSGQHEFFPGKPSSTFGYNGAYLGPTLRVHRGDDVQIAVTNALNVDTTVHWHGLLVPGELDGGPHQIVRPGATWRPVLPIRQAAATLWYHSHVHGRTAEQVYAGLAGLLIVTDEHEQTLGLPSDYGVDDLPLIVQDRQFQDGVLTRPQGMMTRMLGARGETLVVNGAVNPVARVPRRRVRLRLANGANARQFDFSFSDGRAFDWIASEGGLLAKPVSLTSLTLTPGERAEILVDFSDGRAVALQTAPDASLPTMAATMVPNERMTVVRFAPQAVPGDATRPQAIVPATLTEPAPKDNATAAAATLVATETLRRRRFVMNMGMGGNGAFTINGRAFAMARVNETVRLGDTEIWEVTSSMMAHPFHIHGVHFQVLRRNGAAPALRDQGIKDTVFVAQQETVELLVTFTHPASSSAPFMYHCHVLEHEDQGMMGQFAVG